eukprot:3170823-Pleurochrysis_carterae.AAC.4
MQTQNSALPGAAWKACNQLLPLACQLAQQNGLHSPEFVWRRLITQLKRAFSRHAYRGSILARWRWSTPRPTAWSAPRSGRAPATWRRRASGSDRVQHRPALLLWRRPHGRVGCALLCRFSVLEVAVSSAWWQEAGLAPRPGRRLSQLTGAVDGAVARALGATPGKRGARGARRRAARQAKRPAECILPEAVRTS